MIKLISATFGGLLLLAAPLSMAADLTVVIDNVKSTDGTIQVSVNNEAGYGGMKRPIAFGSVKPELPSVSLVIADIEPGDIAVSVRHDENDNDELDRNFLGAPKEPWGLSNNPSATFKRPGWDDAKIRWSGKETVAITLK